MQKLTPIKTFLMKKTTMIFIAGMVTMAILLMIISPLTTRREVIRKDCNQEKTFCFFVIKTHKLFSSHIQFQIGAYVEKGLPNYGHYVAYPFPYAPDAINEADQIKKANVEFTEEGIVYTHPTNHILLIPKKEYTVTR